MVSPVGLYPLSTQQGDSIPLEVIKSVSLISKSLTTTSASWTIPTDAAMAVLMADKDSIVSLGATIPTPLVDGTNYAGFIFLPANTALTVVVAAGTAYAKCLSGTGTLYCQIIEKWAGLGFTSRYNNL